MLNGVDRLRRYLDDQGVRYRMREHPEVFTTQELAALEHVSGRRMAKVVMVLADQRLVMLVLPASARMAPEKAASALEVHDLRLAHEEEFTPSFPDCDAGAMPPFGNLYGIPVYVDRPLADSASIVFQAGSHRHTMALAYEDFDRLVRPVVASLSDPASFT